MNYGMIRVAAASLKLKVANPSYNKEEIKQAIDRALKEDVRLLVTPELSVTGASCGDLFFSRSLLESSDRALTELVEYTKDKNICVVVGAPCTVFSKLYNCAFVLQNGKVRKIIPQSHTKKDSPFSVMSNEGLYSVQFDALVNTDCVIDLGSGALFGVEIGEDFSAAVPPSDRLACEGANLILNLSAEAETLTGAQYRRNRISMQSAKGICAYVYAGASVYESTTDSVCSGATLIAENGTVIAEGKRFSRENVLTIADVDVEKLNLLRSKTNGFTAGEDYLVNDEEPLNNETNDLKYRYIDPHPFVPSDEKECDERCGEAFAVQANALAGRLAHIGSKGCVIGISGGLDSTLALLVSVEAMKILGKPVSDIIGITMPGFGTTDRTYHNAVALMKSLGITVKEISIKDACLQHFKDIGHNPDIKDVTYENAQARERTQILFDIANQNNSLLVGTGDLSELAMGWCTFSGDHMCMYGVNASVPKTLIRYLVKYVAKISDEITGAILLDIVDTPVSPELLPPDENGNIAQKTEDNIGPYELHDFFLYHFIRFGYTKEKLAAMALKAFNGKYDAETVEKWLNVFIRRFFISQFKRSCSPDGPKVGSVSLSPRGDWHMPSDASFNDFI